MGEMCSPPGKLVGGSSASPSLVASTFITCCATMEGKCMVISKNEEILVDRYNPETSIVYQFYGCK